MTDYRTDAPNTGQPTHTTIIEKRGGGSGVVMIALVLLGLIAAIAYFMVTKDNREASRDQAVSGAMQSVDDAATKVGDAAQRAADKMK
jgi:uncharacterized protein HemX